LNRIELTVLCFISNINIQFSPMSIGMRKYFLYYVSTAIIFAGLLPFALSISSVYGQQPLISPDSRPPLPPPSPRFHIPFGQPPSLQASNFTFGPIASIQNNESGQPAWIVVGNWRSNLLSFNQTTTQNSDNNASSLAAAVFHANFRMIMLNGSGAHTHVITNFKLSNISSYANGTTTYIGNSTISMPAAPIVDVPTTIKISGEVISIFPDPAKVNEHFGNTPIYGVVVNGLDNENARRLLPPPPSGPRFP
jgi:hypothetical protein